MSKKLNFAITPQPTETTCGHSCLHAVYQYFEDPVELDQIMREIKQLPDGGSLAVFLGLHALQRGYEATIYTCNLQMFDPTWNYADSAIIRDKLVSQMSHRKDEKLRIATESYLKYLDAGGQLFMQDITPRLIRECLEQGQPIITALSATWLYQTARERPEDSSDDDVAGDPLGHFIVIHGIASDNETAFISDPYPAWDKDLVPQAGVSIDRLIASIMLGVITYDAKLLVLTPPAG